MNARLDDLVDLPIYREGGLSFSEACEDAKVFAHDYACDAWVVRFSSENNALWKVRGPAEAVAQYVAEIADLEASEDEDYVEVDDEPQIDQEASAAWRERYGTPWSAP